MRERRRSCASYASAVTQTARTGLPVQVAEDISALQPGYMLASPQPRRMTLGVRQQPASFLAAEEFQLAASMSTSTYSCSDGSGL
jgi:hypothetical protein